MKNLALEIAKELLLAGKEVEIKETKEGFKVSIAGPKKKVKTKKVKNTHLTIDQVVASRLAYRVSWRQLKGFCETQGFEIIKVPCEKYEEVNAYPVEAFKIYLGVSKKDLKKYNLFYK